MWEKKNQTEKPDKTFICTSFKRIRTQRNKICLHKLYYKWIGVRKMFQSNFLRKLGQGIPKFSTKPLWSHNSAWGREKKILFSLSLTPLFILQSSLVVIRLYSEIDRKTGINGEKEGGGSVGRNEKTEQQNQWYKTWASTDQERHIFVHKSIKIITIQAAALGFYYQYRAYPCPMINCLKGHFSWHKWPNMQEQQHSLALFVTTHYIFIPINAFSSSYLEYTLACLNHWKKGVPKSTGMHFKVRTVSFET